MPGFGNAIGIPFIRRKLSGLRAKFRGDATMTAMLDGILRDLQADFVSQATVTAALETIKLLDADFSGEGTVTGELLDFTGLLDDYPNAEAAYSVRLLRIDYTGGLVEIRRSSDNATKAFLPDSNNELSLSSEAVVGSQSLSAFIGSNDGFVVTWYDQSGNSNDATQSTASAQPQIISSGALITAGSKAAIKNNGTGFLSNSLLSLGATDRSFTGVFRIDGAGDNFGPLFDGNPDRIYVGRDGANFATFFDEINDVVLEPYTNYIGNRYLFSEYIESGVDDSFYTNGVNDFTNSDNTGASDGLTIFSIRAQNRESDASCQELIIWESNQKSNRLGIETNINDYYSIY